VSGLKFLLVLLLVLAGLSSCATHIKSQCPNGFFTRKKKGKHSPATSKEGSSYKWSRGTASSSITNTILDGSPDKQGFSNALYHLLEVLLKNFVIWM
jgi:hypothetical protein